MDEETCYILNCFNCHNSRCSSSILTYFSLFIESYINPLQNQKQIEISPNYKDNIDVDLYVEGLSFPTSMTFVDDNTILVSEKDQGNVRLISNGTLQEDPIYTIR